LYVIIFIHFYFKNKNRYIIKIKGFTYRYFMDPFGSSTLGDRSYHPGTSTSEKKDTRGASKTKEEEKFSFNEEEEPKFIFNPEIWQEVALESNSSSLQAREQAYLSQEMRKQELEGALGSSEGMGTKRKESSASTWSSIREMNDDSEVIAHMEFAPEVSGTERAELVEITRLRMEQEFGEMFQTQSAIKARQDKCDKFLEQTLQQNPGEIPKNVMLAKVKFGGIEAHGIFAKEDIPKHTILGFYAGKIVKLDSIDEKNRDYVFQFAAPEDFENGSLVIDAKHQGNWTRFMNSAYDEKGNVQYFCFVHEEVPYILFETTQNIEAGSEVNFYYGKDYPWGDITPVKPTFVGEVPKNSAETISDSKIKGKEKATKKSRLENVPDQFQTLEGRNVSPKRTVGGGACALHALLGSATNEGRRFKTNSQRARNAYAQQLKNELKRENSVPQYRQSLIDVIESRENFEGNLQIILTGASQEVKGAIEKYQQERKELNDQIARLNRSRLEAMDALALDLLKFDETLKAKLNIKDSDVQGDIVKKVREGLQDVAESIERNQALLSASDYFRDYTGAVHEIQRLESRLESIKDRLAAKKQVRERYVKAITDENYWFTTEEIGLMAAIYKKDVQIYHLSDSGTDMAKRYSFGRSGSALRVIFAERGKEGEGNHFWYCE